MIYPQITIPNSTLQTNKKNLQLLNYIEHLTVIGEKIILDLACSSNFTLLRKILDLSKNITSFPFIVTNVKLDDSKEDEIVTLFELGCQIIFFKLSTSDEDDELKVNMLTLGILPRNRVGICTSLDCSSININDALEVVTLKIEEFQDSVMHFMFELIVGPSYDLKKLATDVKKIIVSFSELGIQIEVYFSLAVRTPFSDQYLGFVVKTMMESLHICIQPRLQSYEQENEVVLEEDFNKVCLTVPYMENSLLGVSSTDFVGVWMGCIRTDRSDGLFATVVTDEHGVCLGLVYSSRISLRMALMERRGIYWSRSRQQVWRKGENSGTFHKLVNASIDCDSDTLRFIVMHNIGSQSFCHLSTRTCWGDKPRGIYQLQRSLEERRLSAPEDSYTKTLLNNPELLRKRLLSEVNDFVNADTKEDITNKAAELIYYVLTKCCATGITLSDIEMRMDTRSFQITKKEQKTTDKDK
jgi:phosphoribosyl-ATP pyrophosphohydrolase